MANKKAVNDGPACRKSGSSSSLANIQSSRDYKKGMAENNERLANLLSRKRELEIENENLHKELESRDQIHAKEMESLKELFDNKSNESEKLIDQLTQEKAKQSIELDRLRSSNLDLITTNEALQKELQKTIKTYEQAIKSKDELLSQETLRSVSLENKLKSLNEQLNLNQQIEEKKLRELRKQLEEKYEERFRRELDQQIEQAIEEQQRELEREAKLLRVEIDQELKEEYDFKLISLNEKLNEKNAREKELSEELIVLQNRIVELSATEQELRDAVLRIEGAKSDLMKSLLKKENEVKELEQVIKDKDQEYAEVLNERNTMAEAMETYRRLLDNEEQRHSQLNDGSGDGLPSSFRPIGSPRRISLINNRKRPRMIDEENYYDTHIECEGDGPIRIKDFDQERKCVEIVNESEEAISLAGWSLKQVVDQNLYDFKFGRSIVVQPGKTVTVWSKSGNGVHELPHSIVMKADWQIGAQVEFNLLNSNKEQVYRRTTSQQVRRIKKRISSVNRPASPQSEKCVLM